MCNVYKRSTRAAHAVHTSLAPSLQEDARIWSKFDIEAKPRNYIMFHTLTQKGPQKLTLWKKQWIFFKCNNLIEDIWTYSIWKV